MAGQGIALGSMVLADALLRNGELACASDCQLVTHDAYYLTYDAEQAMRPAVSRAKQWLLQEVKEFCLLQGWEHPDLSDLTSA